MLCTIISIKNNIIPKEIFERIFRYIFPIIRNTVPIKMRLTIVVIDKIPDEYMTPSVQNVPLLFMGLSAPVIILGGFLLKIKKKRPKKEYF